jgi:hypothetical protein
MNLNDNVALVAGFGRFYVAGRQLHGKSRDRYSDLTLIMIKDDKQRGIAIKYSINPGIFKQDIRGCGYCPWKPLISYHFMK